MPDIADMREVKWTPERVARLWDYYSRNKSLDAQYFARQYGRDIVDTVDRYIDLSTARYAIDYGSGPGFLVEHLLAWPNLKVTGLDFSQASVDALEQRFRGSLGFERAVLVRDLPAPIEDASADALFLIEVVEHLNDEFLSATLAEANRLLAPGGYIIVTTPNEEDLDVDKTCCPECGCVFNRWQHVRAWTAASLQQAMSSAGFRRHRLEQTVWLSMHGPRWRVLFQRWRRARLQRKAGKLPHLMYIGRKL